MECDRDTGRVKMTLKAEVPADWMRYFREAQKDPRPFIVKQPGREDFFKYEQQLGPLFFAKCPIPTRPIRELRFSLERPGKMVSREFWNGHEMETQMTKKAARTDKLGPLRHSYLGRLPLSKQKLDALALFWG